MTEHDVAQLPADARARPNTASGGRDRLHPARPRRERLTVARARRGPRRRPLRRRARRLARPRRPRGAAQRPDASRRLPGRLERRRDEAGRGAIVELAHGAGALAWADAVHYGPHGQIDVPAGTSTCSSARRTSSSGRTWGLASASASPRGLRPYKVRLSDNEPVGNRFQHGRSSTSCSPASSPRSSTSSRSAGTRSRTRRSSDSASSTACRRGRALRLRTMEGACPRSRSIPGPHSPRRSRSSWRPRDRGLARRLLRGRDHEAARAGGHGRRAGIVHYNTADEVDRLLTALAELRDVVELLQELIRFDTTNLPGNEAACIEFVRAQLEEAGCETEIYAKEPSRPNLVSRLFGGDAPPLLLQGHVDVVTTAGQDWSTRPSRAGSRTTGWGRGALDMKAGVAMLVSAFCARSGRTCRCRATSSSSSSPTRRRRRPRRALPGRGASGAVRGHALCARRVRRLHAHLGGKRFYPIQVAEKQICWLKATCAARRPRRDDHRGGTVARLASSSATSTGSGCPCT